MKIGELASTTGTPVETLRFYEREGLLPETARTDGNFRIYSNAHVERVSFIRHCRTLDMALDEIRVLLTFKDAPSENCGGVNALLDEHIGHVAARIRELRALEKQLISLREQCAEVQDSARCGILHGLSQSSRVGATLGTGHLAGVHGRTRARKA